MNNHLPILDYGVNEKNGVPVVSSRKVAEVFNKRHSDVLRDIDTGIENLIKANERRFAEINFLKSTYRDDRNRRQPECLLTKDGFTYNTMGYSGVKAARFKVAYINRFNQMEAFIKSLYEAKADFPEFTQAIMLTHDEPKHYHFSNELDMINRIVLGMSAKQFREFNNLDKVQSIRPYLSTGQIQSIQTLQRVDIGLIVAVPDFQERKRILSDYYLRNSRRAIA